MRWLFVTILSAICCPALFSQTIIYTVKDVLPSNSVYRTILDNRGFLWIATENGVARFDGKKFENYTISSGLTDNEVIDLFIDSNKTIWTIPFRRSPCYFVSKKNRFVNEETDAELAKVQLGNTHMANVLSFGGIIFCNNERNLFVFKDGRTSIAKNFISGRYSIPQKIVEYQPGKLIMFSEDSFRYVNNGRLIGSVANGRKAVSAEYVNGKIFLAGIKSIRVLRVEPTGSLTMSCCDGEPVQKDSLRKLEEINYTRRFIWAIQSLDFQRRPLNDGNVNGDASSEPVMFYISPTPQSTLRADRGQ
ncbi:MAG: hypothetical protein C4308_05140 [Chitinophagaceae bacterium]